MATKEDFTEDEWGQLHKGVMGAGFLVSVGDRDFTDTFGEVGALAKRMREEHEQSSSELVRDLGGVHGSGFGLTASTRKVEEETLAALHAALATLAAKAPEEVEAYQQFVLGVANAVAEAKGGVKAGETAAIAKITQALGAG